MNTQKRDIFEMWAENGDLDRILAFIRDCARKLVNSLCEKCGSPGLEVHHIIHLTPDNVDDVSISINLKNLIYLCKECHNKEHGRFSSKTDYKFDCDGNVVKK